MKHKYSRPEIERYLLGEGSEEERARIAEELIADPDFHAWVREVEAEQLDALARGELKGADAAAWRDFVDQTGQMDRLRVARALARKMQSRAGFARWMQIAAALLVIIGAAWWWTVREKPQVPVVAALRASLELPRDITRGASREPQLRISKDVTEVELRFEVAAEPAVGYRLIVRNGAGETVLVREGAGWPSGVLSIVVPAAAIPTGIIDLELAALNGEKAASPVGFHRVRVSR